jgi:hypothetical protein
MATFNPSDFADRNSDANFARVELDLPGFKSARRVTASVSDILRRRNNPFNPITSRSGFAAMGISTHDLEHCLSPRIPAPEIAEGATIENPDFKPELLLACVPKIAEAAVLLTCSKDELRAFYEDATFKRLDDAIFEFMDARTEEEILGMMQPIADELLSIRKATAIIPDKGDEPPEDPKKNVPSPPGAPST